MRLQQGGKLIDKNKNDVEQNCVIEEIDGDESDENTQITLKKSVQPLMLAKRGDLMQFDQIVKVETVNVPLIDVVKKYVEENKVKLRKGLATTDVIAEIKTLDKNNSLEKKIREEMTDYCKIKRVTIDGKRSVCFVLNNDDEIDEIEETESNTSDSTVSESTQLDALVLKYIEEHKGIFSKGVPTGDAVKEIRNINEKYKDREVRAEFEKYCEKKQLTTSSGRKMCYIKS